MRPLLLLACLVLALFAAACGDDEDSKTDTGSAAATTPAATTEAPAAPGECTKATPKTHDGKVGKPTGKLDPAKTYVATVVTNCGTFEITLDVKRAPKTSNSFKHLADEGFYDGLSFHRIVPDFVIQGGDPEGTGMGGPDYSIEEAPPSDLTYDKGVVAMAKTGAEPPGTSGSQFYVVSGAGGQQLPPEYALVGKVTKGQDVVDAIGAVETDSSERPVEPVVIESVKVSES